jgi:hypothetical protein
MGWLGDLRITAETKATGVWNSSRARFKAEYGLFENEFSSGFRTELKEKIKEIDRVTTSAHNNPAMAGFVKTLDENRPDSINSGIKSFLSVGSGKAALAGAVAGGAYGVMSDDISIAKGAMYGGGIGYISKGLFGIAGERRTLMNRSDKAISEIQAMNNASNSLNGL